jgi:hypothetical protein
MHRNHKAPCMMRQRERCTWKPVSDFCSWRKARCTNQLKALFRLIKAPILAVVSRTLKEWGLLKNRAEVRSRDPIDSTTLRPYMADRDPRVK